MDERKLFAWKDINKQTLSSGDYFILNTNLKNSTGSPYWKVSRFEESLSFAKVHLVTSKEHATTPIGNLQNPTTSHRTAAFQSKVGHWQKMTGQQIMNDQGISSAKIIHKRDKEQWVKEDFIYSLDSCNGIHSINSLL